MSTRNQWRTLVGLVGLFISLLFLAREGQAVTYTPVTDALGRAGGARAINIKLLPAGYAVEKLP